jgi:long-chain acyl-CoA synthetase
MDKPTRLFEFPLFQLKQAPMEVMMTSRCMGEWKTYSTAEFVANMNALSHGLLALGVEPGDKIALISHNNRCEWNICDHGILQIGAIDVPIYPTMTPKDYEYILGHSEAKYCFVSNQEIYDKVSSVKDSLPQLKEVYSFEPTTGKSWQEVLKSGVSGDDKILEATREKIDQDDLATLIYTSGTTGLPKGVMLSHRNIASNAVDSTERLPQAEGHTFRVLSFLPVCHIFERMLHYLYMYNGATIYFAESLETIKEDLQISQPHMFTAVPRLLEKFYDGIVANGQKAGGLKTAIFNWAVDVALQWEPGNANGAVYKMKLGIADKLVYSKIRAALALTEIKAVASGSAALQARLARFFNAIQVPVYEGYGLTETSPVISVNTLSTPNMLRIGSVGKPIAHVEVRIAEDGEILCKGPNVMMGYYKNPETTAEVLKDGWFHTGDIGVIEDGFLRITDRKKEIFKTSGGKYIAPQALENALKASLFIEQCMMLVKDKNTQVR